MFVITELLDHFFYFLALIVATHTIIYAIYPHMAPPINIS